LLSVQLPAAFKSSIASRSIACGVQRFNCFAFKCFAFNAARSIASHSMLRVQLPEAFNASRSMLRVQSWAFNALRSIGLGVQ
jgi:hypothetical protein